MATHYDAPDASDGHGGPHPLAGVPDEALQAAQRALRDGLTFDSRTGFYVMEPDDVEPVADAIVAAALVALRAAAEA